MFTQREVRLLAILLGMKDWIPGKTLCEMLAVSLRTLQSEVDAVNSVLRKQFSSAGIASNNRLGYRLEGNRESIRRFVAEKGSSRKNDSFESANAILTVLLYEKDYITLNKIAEKTFLAVSSVSANLEKVKKMISRAKGAVLDIHPRKGYRLLADESVKRMLIVNALADEGTQISSQYPEISEGYEMLEDIKSVMVSVFVPDSYIIEGKAFDAFCRYCVFSLTRQLNGHILEAQKKHEISAIGRKIGEAIREELNYEISDQELMCLDERLEDLNVIGTAKKDYPKIESQILDFCNIVTKETGLTLDLETDRLKRLSEHLYRTQRRLEVGNYLRTSDPETIEKQYPVALHLVRTCFAKAIASKLPGNEERLIVPYIASLIGDTQIKVNVNIVSDLPVGEIYRYRARMYDMFKPLIGRIRIFPTYLYEERFADSDPDALFFTTEEELVFAHDELTYIDLYEDFYQNDMILRSLRDKSTELKMGIFEDYRKLSKNETFECGDEESGLSDLLKRYTEETEQDDLSCCLIDGDVLLAISHGGSRHIARNVLIKGKAIYGNKPINRMLYFNIGRKEDAKTYCEYIKEALNKRV